MLLRVGWFVICLGFASTPLSAQVPNGSHLVSESVYARIARQHREAASRKPLAETRAPKLQRLPTLHRLPPTAANPRIPNRATQQASYLEGLPTPPGLIDVPREIPPIEPPVPGGFVTTNVADERAPPIPTPETIAAAPPETVTAPTAAYSPPDYLIGGRVTPPTVNEFDQSHDWHLELGEALFIAMKRSPDIAIMELDMPIAETAVSQELDRFDPQLETNQHWTESQQAVANNVPIFGTGSPSQQVASYGANSGRPDQLAISKNLRTGGSLRGSFTTGRNKLDPAGTFTALNPAWRSSLNLRFTQPLGAGRGRKIQLLPMQIAQSFYDSSAFDFQAATLRLARDVELAYWSLVFSLKNVEVLQRDVGEARKTYEKELEKLAIGESSRPEIGEVKLNYYRNIDALQQRKTELIEAERAFRELIGIQGFDDRRIVVRMPDGHPVIDVDWHESVEVMLASRPDLISQRKRLEAARMRYELAANRCLPNVNFESTLSKSGLDNSFDGSMDQLAKSDDYSWLVGISAARGVNRYGIKAEMRRANLVWTKEEAVTRKAEYSAIHAMQRAYSELHHRVDRVKQMKNVLDAAEERFAAYKEKFELGELAIELYLRAQAARSDAERQLELARVQLMQSSVEFEFVRGTLLDVRSVAIGSREPMLSPSEQGLHLDDLPPQKQPELPRAPTVEEMLEQANPTVKELLSDPPSDAANAPTFEEMLQNASPKVRELLNPVEQSQQTIP